MANFFDKFDKKDNFFDQFDAQPNQSIRTNDFIPTDEAMALTQAEMDARQQPERGVADYLTGIGEAALTMGTGATGGFGGYLKGAAEGLGKQALGSIGQQEAQRIAEQEAARFTYEPRTEVGREIVKDISELLGVLPPVVAGFPSGSARIASTPATKTIKTAKLTRQKLSKVKSGLADEIAAGNRNAENIAATLDQDGLLIRNPKHKAAKKILGGESATAAALNAETMNKADKKIFNKMLDRVAENQLRPDLAMENRPANEIGKGIALDVLKLDKVRKGAGKQLTKALDEHGGKPVSITEARNRFLKDLESKGATFDVSDDGRILVNLDRATFKLGDVMPEAELNRLINMLDDEMTANRAHELKRLVRENVDYSDTPIGGVKQSKVVEDALKELSADINLTIQNTVPGYKKANKKYENVMNALKVADKALGKNLLIGDKLAAQKLADLAKRIGTNYGTRDQVISMIDEINKALKKEGMPSKMNIAKQVRAAADIEKIFNLEGDQAPFSIGSRMAEGIGAAATGDTTGALLRSATKRLSEMAEPDFKKKMAAFRKLAEIK